jgi:hypothetical protein
MAAEATTPQTPNPLRGQRGVLLLATVAAAGLWAVWPQASALHAIVAAVLVGAWVGCAIASRGGAALAATNVTAPQLVSRTDVIIAGDRLLARTRQKAQPLTIAIVEVADIADVERLFGQGIAESVMVRLARKLRGAAGPRGLAARTGQTQFCVLLPAFAAEDALATLRTVFGESGCLEDETRDELVLLPDVKLDAVGPEHSSVEVVYDSLCAAMARIHRSAAFAPTVAAAAGPDEHRAALAQAQARRASLYAPTVPLSL